MVTRTSTASAALYYGVEALECPSIGKMGDEYDPYSCYRTVFWTCITSGWTNTGAVDAEGQGGNARAI